MLKLTLESIICSMFSLYLIERINYSRLRIENRIKYVLTMSLLLIALTYVNIFMKVLFIVITSTFLSFNYLKIRIKIKLSTCILSNLICYLIIALSDMATAAIMNYTLHIYPFKLRSSIILTLLFYAVMALIIGGIVKIMRKFNYFVYISDDNEMQNNRLSIIFLFITLLVVCTNIQLYSFISQEDHRAFLFFSSILLALYFILSLFTLYLNNGNNPQNQNNEQIKLHTSIMEQFIQDIRIFRHDYLNIMLTLKEYIANHDIDGLEHYYCKEILKDSEILLNNQNMLVIQKLKVPAIKGLISSKIVQAENGGVRVHIDILDEIDSIPMRIIDLCKVLGILLDNAREAAMESEKKLILINIVNDHEYISFTISNTFRALAPVSRMYEKGFSTKGLTRGWGLSIARRIIDVNYENVLLNTTRNKDLFQQELNIKKPSFLPDTTK